MLKFITNLITIITGYRLFVAIESSKTYRRILHVMSSIGFSVFLGYLIYVVYLCTRNTMWNYTWNDLSTALTLLLLYLTWIGAMWVARETYDQKNIANKQIIEARKQLAYELGPYLRPQFMRQNSDNNIIKIKNHGRGCAIDVEFDLIDIPSGGDMNPIKIMTRPIITPEGTSFVGAMELVRENKGTDKQSNLNSIRTWIETCIEENIFEIRCTYKDTAGNKYKAVFKGNASYFDGFQIIEQKRV